MRTALAIATRLSLAAIGGALGVVAAAAGCVLIDRRSAEARSRRRHLEACNPGTYQASPYTRKSKP